MGHDILKDIIRSCHVGEFARMRNYRGQINFGFIVAVVLLVVLVISSTQSILRTVPGVKDETKASVLFSKARSLNELMLDTPGDPPGWSSSDPTYFGLAEYDAYSQEVILGRLSHAKVSHASSSMSYHDVATLLNVGNDTSFRLLVNDSATMDMYHELPGSASNAVVMKRVMVMDDQPINVTLTVWQE